MDKDGYMLYLKRKNSMCNKDGEPVTGELADTFKNGTNDKFITISNNKLGIKTPICRNVLECYDKFNEITNLALCEIRKHDVLLTPCNVPYYLMKNDYDCGIIFGITFNDKLLNRVEKINVNVPKDINRMYLCIKKCCESKIWMLDYILGKNFNESGNNMINSRVELEVMDGVNYLEIKLQTNPFEKCGISKFFLKFLLVFMVNNLIEGAKNANGCIEKLANDKENVLFSEFNKLLKIDEELGLKCRNGIIGIKDTLSDYSKKMQNIKDSEILELAKEYSEEAYNTRYRIEAYPYLDGSAVALIKDALEEGVDFNVIEEGKSFIELKNKGKRELVIMATMTNKDSYILPYITDDKHFAKEVMADNELNVPQGIVIKRSTDEDEREDLIKTFIGKPVVVKPRTTNSGVGISVFSVPICKEKLEDAIDYALEFDSDVLVEEFIEGNEYRFVIVDDKCVSVVHRRSASVLGDGISTIHELIEKKNKEPWHCLLDNPVLEDKPAEDFLKHNKYSFEYVPCNGDRIFLRENSNCSTGGESIDVTDKIPYKFKEIAEKASHCFDAKISGVDIIINDLDGDDYSIIEVNDNPGFSINEWPYEGKGEKVGREILKLLNLI